MPTQKQLIGTFVANLRKKRGLTQKELAKLLETSQSAVARIERGEQNMTIELISKISQALSSNILNLSRGMTHFRVEGGHKLSGAIDINVSKNAAVGLLCASLLNKGKTTLKRMPRIEEVFRIIEVLESVGVKANWINGNDLELQPPKRLKLSKMNIEAARRTRSIIMFLGPLMHMVDHFQIPYAGGCKLGTRTVRPHLYALEEFGLSVETKEDIYQVKVGKRKAVKELVLYESGDTVTENVLMAAARMPGETVVKFASANYMVQEVAFFLQELGVEIEGIGTTTMRIKGMREINKDVVYSPSEDPIEVMSFLAAAIVTKSSITLRRCPIDFIELELLKLKKMGFKYTQSKRYKAANGKTDLVDITTKSSKLKALKEKIAARPYPGINIDNLPFFVPIASMAEGRTLIHDWVYENRAIYYTEMNKIGARVQLADMHRAFIDGPAAFHAAEVMSPPALRPAIIILIGMLGAKGTSMLRNVYSINRGYEALAERLQKLGAKVEVITDLS